MPFSSCFSHYDRIWLADVILATAIVQVRSMRGGGGGAGGAGRTGSGREDCIAGSGAGGTVVAGYSPQPPVTTAIMQVLNNTHLQSTPHFLIPLIHASPGLHHHGAVAQPTVIDRATGHPYGLYEVWMTGPAVALCVCGGSCRCLQSSCSAASQRTFRCVWGGGKGS